MRSFPQARNLLIGGSETYRQEYQRLYEGYSVPFGRPENLAGFARELEENKSLELAFWALTRSIAARSNGELSREGVLITIASSLVGPDTIFLDPEGHAVLDELGAQMDGRLAEGGSVPQFAEPVPASNFAVGFPDEPPRTAATRDQTAAHSEVTTEQPRGFETQGDEVGAGSGGSVIAWPQEPFAAAHEAYVEPGAAKEPEGLRDKTAYPAEAAVAQHEASSTNGAGRPELFAAESRLEPFGRAPVVRAHSQAAAEATAHQEAAAREEPAADEGAAAEERHVPAWLRRQPDGIGSFVPRDEPDDLPEKAAAATAAELHPVDTMFLRSPPRSLKDVSKPERGTGLPPWADPQPAASASKPWFILVPLALLLCAGLGLLMWRKWSSAGTAPSVTAVQVQPGSSDGSAPNSGPASPGAAGSGQAASGSAAYGRQQDAAGARKPPAGVGTGGGPDVNTASDLPPGPINVVPRAPSSTPSLDSGGSLADSSGARPDYRGSPSRRSLKSPRVFVGKSGTITASSGVMTANLVQWTPPNYPGLARMMHTEGPVILQAIISENGTVDHVKVLKGHRLLRGAATNAVQRWRYKPYTVNGAPMPVATIIVVDFKLRK